MAKAKKKETTTTAKFDKPRTGCRPVWSCVFFVLALWLLVSLWHFAPEQSVRNITDPTSENLGGRFGAELAWSAFVLFGGAGWLLAIVAFYLSYMFLLFPKRLGLVKLFALVGTLIATSALFGMQEVLFLDQAVYRRGPGGIVGSLLYERLLRDNLGVFGSLLLLSIANILAIFLLVTSNIGEAFQHGFIQLNEWKNGSAARRTERREARRKERELKHAQKLEAREKRRKEKEGKAKLAAKRKLEKELEGDEPIEVAAPIPAAKPKPAARPDRSRPTASDPVEPPAPAPAAPAEPARQELPKPKIIKSEMLRKAPVKLPERIGDYQFPTLDLLSKPEPVPSDDRENHEERAQALIHTLATFGVQATVDEIHVGPVITRFDILPAPGTKVSKIQGLENDIAMGLKALAVRILAPVPGKGCVGVEIPNHQPQPVCLREIIESEDWSSSRAEIPIGLGKDVSGKPLVADLTKMPHLLIAGSTGSGKTVCINSIIASLLYHASPDDLRFIMVDPKIVEMKVFNDLPHMLIPVVTEPKKVPGALKWLLNEMERRYQCFATIGVRNIAGFHAYQKKKKAEREKAAQEAAETEPNELDGFLPEAVAPEMEPEEGMEIPDKLPYIVCIIDELADLMMVAPAEIETGIARLAQLARAAGIHLILATQRPSVNVITGVIKANLPSRISFKVASKVDSRTILDTGGADTLIGRGDMLFLPPGSSRLIRSQGAFVSDEEITDIVEFLKQNGPPHFAEEVQRQVDSGGDDEEGFDGGEEEDELFQDALEVLRNTKRASTSMLQRRLRIGYNRAARIMELMEQRGVVGPENGSSPREILVDLESL